MVVVMLSGWLRGFNYFNIYIQKEQIDFASVVVFLCPSLRPVLAEGGGKSIENRIRVVSLYNFEETIVKNW